MNRFIWFYKANTKKTSPRSSRAFQFHPGFFSFWQISKWESYVVEVREGGPSSRWKSSKLHLCNSTFLGKRTFSSRFFHIFTFQIDISNWHWNRRKLSALMLTLVFWHLLTISSRPCCSFGHFNSNRCQSLRKRNVPTIVLSMVQKKKLMTNSSAFSCLEVQLERGNHSVACIWSAIHSKHTSHIKWSTDECVPLLDLDDHGQDLGGHSGAEWIAKYKKVHLGLVIGDTK